MAITVKSKEEIALLREGGKRLARILDRVAAAATPGLSTLELDRLAESLILASGGEPSFKWYRIEGVRSAYPATICISVNDEVVHSIPKKDKILKEGDIVALDIGMRWPGQELKMKDAALRNAKSLYTDMAVTIGIGRISPESEMLLAATREALEIGIGMVAPGKRVGDVSHAIQTHLASYHLGIVRELAGHGVGYKVHEEPLIPNFGKANSGPELVEGMVIAIEPIANLGSDEVALQSDEWTFKTADGSMSAHFEHTMAVTQDGVEVLTR